MVIQPVSPSIISLQRIISAKPFCFRFYTTPTPPSVSASTRTTRSRHCNYTTARILDYNGCCTLAAPLPCGKFKPKLVQKSFLRKSQDPHLDAVPTTYAQRSLRKRGSHTQALRFGAAQPFWTLSQRCCSNKKTHEPKQQARQARWTKPRDCLRLLLCSFLGFEPKATIQLDCNNCLNVQDPKIFLKKTLFN